MTKEELREHCEKQVKMCEKWAKVNDREPSGKIYEEHKLVLDLIKSSEDKSYELWKESYEEERLRNIRLEEKFKALEQQPCDDCVSRQAVKDTIFAECSGNKLDIDFAKVLLLQRAIKALPPVTPTTQSWIPISERLPKDRNLVLVTAYWHETYQVMMASYFGEGLWWCVPFNNCGDHMQKLNPKAWQPLPKPYKEKRGSEND